MRAILKTAGGILLVSGLICAASAQPFPSKQMRMIVPAAAGGSATYSAG